jgi:hypothetical protein
MTHITEHYSEQEWESNYSEYSWVYFLILWDTISVNDLLEYTCELISLYVSRWSDRVIFKSVEVSSRVVREHTSYFSFLDTRAPEVTDICGLTLLHVVQCMIEGLLF